MVSWIPAQHLGSDRSSNVFQQHVLLSKTPSRELVDTGETHQGQVLTSPGNRGRILPAKCEGHPVTMSPPRLLQKTIPVSPS